MPRLKLVGLAAGGHTEFDGAYVVEYDPWRKGVSPSGHLMTCHLIVTRNPDKAKVYASSKEAFEEWKRDAGVRPDGEPNRPLTAYNVEIS